jgi:glycosyltransferase involved in cell wall biosynthesis
MHAPAATPSDDAPTGAPELISVLGSPTPCAPVVAHQRPDLSVVLAVYNEVDSLPELRRQLVEALDALDLSWEAVFIDDGSNDGSRARQIEFCKEDARFRSIHLRRNFGKAAALDTGFRMARGRYVVTMDADLQDDPAQIPLLLAPILADEADMVSGWKWPRRDPIGKRLPSKVYNWFTRLTTGLDLHDMNCGLKAYRAEVVRELRLYGDMHRYIPVIADGAGFVVTEVKVSHRPRIHGESKYAWGRFLRGFLDLLTVLFLTRYQQRPLHLIGTAGLVMGCAGFLVLLYLTALWTSGTPIGSRPLLQLGVLLMVVAGQLFSFGLLAEMMTYIRHREHHDYPIRAIHGADAREDAEEP